MSIINEFVHIFKKCDHKNLEYLGIQKTKDPNVFLFLYNCKNCKSTLTVSSKNKHFKEPK